MTVKIALLCMAGMSTSLLVNKMKQAAQEDNIDANICAYPAESLEKIVADYDVFLLGPQIRYKMNEFKPLVESAGKPIEIIDMMDYGMGNGKKILGQALQLAQLA